MHRTPWSCDDVMRGMSSESNTPSRTKSHTLRLPREAVDRDDAAQPPGQGRTGAPV